MVSLTVSEVWELIVQVYIGQRYEQYVSTALACWFLWDHGELSGLLFDERALKYPSRHSNHARPRGRADLA
jgi:hypothetical protein